LVRRAFAARIDHAMSQTPERSLLARLTYDWLERRTGQSYGALHELAPGVWAADYAAGRLALAVEPASGSEPQPAWSEVLRRFTHRLDYPGDGGVLIWLPPGAAPAQNEPDASVAIAAVQDAVNAATVGSSATALLPITITVRKRDDAGAYVSAFGGLAPLWAQFTDRVEGYYQIDSTQLHRLPDDETYVRGLIDRIVAASKGLQVGEVSSVPAEDHWLVQRVPGAGGCACVALPPGDESETGAPLRRHLRTSLREASARLDPAGPAVRVLAFYAHTASLDDEPVGTALRGQDPALFGGLDLVVVVAEGRVKPLIDVSRHPLLQPRTSAEAQ
jgi:hypothetical protein